LIKIKIVLLVCVVQFLCMTGNEKGGCYAKDKAKEKSRQFVLVYSGLLAAPAGMSARAGQGRSGKGGWA
jgi:hypothetical protein